MQNNDSEYGEWFIACFFVAIGCLLMVLGSLVGYQAGEYNVQKDAVKQGFAIHDSNSGQWRWKDQSEVTFINIVEKGGPNIENLLPPESKTKEK